MKLETRVRMVPNTYRKIPPIMTIRPIVVPTFDHWPPQFHRPIRDYHRRSTTLEPIVRFACHPRTTTDYHCGNRPMLGMFWSNTVWLIADLEFSPCECQKHRTRHRSILGLLIFDRKYYSLFYLQQKKRSIGGWWHIVSLHSKNQWNRQLSNMNCRYTLMSQIWLSPNCSAFLPHMLTFQAKSFPGVKGDQVRLLAFINVHISLFTIGYSWVSSRREDGGRIAASG